LLENPVESRDEWTFCLTSFLYRQTKLDYSLHSHDTKLVRVMTLLVERGCDVNVILRCKDRLRTSSVNDILCRSALEVVESLPSQYQWGKAFMIAHKELLRAMRLRGAKSQSWIESERIEQLAQELEPVAAEVPRDNAPKSRRRSFLSLLLKKR
jgi:hypothetical protein